MSSGHKLYQFGPSPFSAKVRKLLAYKGLEFETVEVDYLDRRELLEVSGQIMVPALRFADGETVVDSNRIAARLEALYPEPTVLPGAWRGLHLALTRYFESDLADALFPITLGDQLDYYGRQGPDRAAFFRLLLERRHGSGFCERVLREREESRERMREVLAPLEEGLSQRAFLLGRLGLADFALYGQLWGLAFTGDLKLPSEFANLRAFFDRIDRLSARLDTVMPQPAPPAPSGQNC